LAARRRRRWRRRQWRRRRRDGPILFTLACTLFTPREFFLRAGFRMLLLALAGVASEQQHLAALQQQVAAQQAQMVALQAQVAALLQNAASTAAAPGAAAGRALSESPHPMFQKLRAMKKQAAYGLGQSQIAANEAISGVKTDPSELKDEFKPGAA